MECYAAVRSVRKGFVRQPPSSDIYAAINEDRNGIGVVTACRPAQWCLFVFGVRATIVHVGTGIDEQLRDAWTVREVARPISHDVKGRPTLCDSSEPGGATSGFCSTRRCTVS